MANFTNTEVHLLYVPLENDYKHTLFFENISAQEEYFLSKRKTVHSFYNLSYQRKDNYIRVPLSYEDCMTCNYVMYKNPTYENKWFYAFINDIKYVDSGRTDIIIETDVIQTWFFDYTVKNSFIEREHVKDDTIGLNTVPEQLETGDYVINKKNKNASLGVHCLIVGSTIDLGVEDFANAEPVAGQVYNGIYSGVKYYETNATNLTKILKALAKAGKSDAITCIFVAPSLFVNSTAIEGSPYLIHEVDEDTESKRKEWVNTWGLEDEENYKPTNLDGYKPKNNKLFTYPYCYMLMSNNSGGSAVYKYELFNHESDNTLCPFYIYCSLTPSMSIFISPRDYNGVGVNSLEGLALGKYPVCNWNTDVYTNWLTQNAVNIPISIGTAMFQTGVGLGQIVASPTTGGLSAVMGATGVVSGLTSIASTVGEIYQHSLQPPQAEGNINSGDVMFSSGALTFIAYQMTIKKEYAKIIDEFFTVYGYKVNRVKTPFKNHRANFWYTKTIDVNIDGAIPNKDISIIKNCYNNGITFWRNPTNIGNYSVNNDIV